MHELLPYAAIAAAIFSLLAALFTCLIFFRSADSGALLKAASDAIRAETDRIRTEASEHARATRLEAAETMRGHQDSLQLKLDSGIEALRAAVSAISQKLDQEITRMGTEAAQGRDTLRKTVEEKLDAANLRSTATARELREELTGNFTKTSEQLSGTLLKLGEHQKERLEKLAAELSAMSERQAASHESLRQTVENRLDVLRSENAAKLDEMRQTVDEKLQTTLEKRLGESFRTVSEQLERVYQGLGEMQTLATGVGDLKKVLSNVKTRGTWGEVQLGMLLEQFLAPTQYIGNAQVAAHSSERVEFVIRFPGRESEDDVLLPIDAKFPQEDHERLILATENADPDGIEAASKALEMRVRSFAKTISEKYINPPTTTDFAILFLPTESLFAEILRRPGLFEELQAKYRVTVSGPTTLTAMLSAFQMGFRSMAIQKRSSEVWKVLGAVRGEFEKHGKVVDKLKSQLNAATNTIESLGTRTRVMRSKLKDIEVLPDESVQSLLGFDGVDCGDAALDEMDEERAEAES